MARERGPLSNLVLRLVINTGALVAAAYVASYVAPGAIIIENWQSALATGAIFGIVNSLIRPLISFFTCLLQVLTLGLFTLVINALMLLLTSWLAGFLDIGFYVDGFWAALFGAILISLVSTVLSRLLR